MDSKVKCTCGWSWNKSDSSAKDMYICHECGRDNSNNMKNGGWLDNYGEEANANEGHSSASKEWVGDGYSNVGRNYSPAWGGQFQEGGEIPMAQDGRATRADSLAVLNSQLALNKFYDKELKAGRLKKDKFPVPPSTDRFKNTIKDLNKENLEFYREQIKFRAKNPYGNNQGTYDDQYKRIFNLTPREVKKLEEQGLIKSKSNTNNKAYYRDKITPMQNLQAPFGLIDSRIIPQGQVDYRSSDMNYPGGDVTVYDYDPLAVTPFDMLTDAQKKERVKKYGTDGVPKSYIDKLKPEDKADKIDKQRSKVEALQPLTQQGVISDFDITAQLPVIRPEARMPKSFDVNSQRQTMSGPSEYYNYSDEGVDISDAVRAKESADAYNQYAQEKYKQAAKTNPKAQKRLEQLMQNVELTPNYQMGGNVYPVNYVPQAQGGMSMPGAVGFTYARTKGIPSNGPYAKKTMASAQNGLEMRYYQNGLDWKPKSISQNGSIVKDDNGYWNPKNWGKPVEIGSNNITMEGVPYDVLGISDTGDTKLMKPGKNYKFKGKKVTEFPMAKNGLRQEQKSLQNLDNLLNFTNYNTKQPGGWLDTL